MTDRGAYNREQKARRRAVLDAEALADILEARLADKLADKIATEVVHRMSAATLPVGEREGILSAEGTSPGPKGPGGGEVPTVENGADRGRASVESATRTRTGHPSEWRGAFTERPGMVPHCSGCGHLVVACSCEPRERSDLA